MKIQCHRHYGVFSIGVSVTSSEYFGGFDFWLGWWHAYVWVWNRPIDDDELPF